MASLCSGPCWSLLTTASVTVARDIVRLLSCCIPAGQFKGTAGGPVSFELSHQMNHVNDVCDHLNNLSGRQRTALMTSCDDCTVSFVSVVR